MTRLLILAVLVWWLAAMEPTTRGDDIRQAVLRTGAAT